jgi:hypothetical protein
MIINRVHGLKEVQDKPSKEKLNETMYVVNHVR